MSRCIKCNLPVEIVYDVKNDVRIRQSDSKDANVQRIEKIIALAIGGETLHSAHHEGNESVCDICVGKVINETKRKTQETRDMRIAIEKALEKLEAEASVGAPNEELDPILDDLNRVEADCKKQLTDLEEEERRLLQELKLVEEDARNLEDQEREYYQNSSDFQVQLREHEEERVAIFNVLRYTKQELEKLKRTSVLNDVFHISCDKAFGCINGFRLGRLPDIDVSWEEINCGWGLTCLLLDVLIKKLRIPQDSLSYRLIARGDFSQISATDNRSQVLDLFGSDSGLLRFFPARKFDAGMTAFLSLVQEVADWLSHRDKNVRLPFKIDTREGRIGGFKIALQYNQLEKWTKSLKFLLINLKWIVAFLESKSSRKSR